MLKFCSKVLIDKFTVPVCPPINKNLATALKQRIIQGWECRYSNIDITEIPKLFSVIFWIPKYRNSSQANFGIIPKYRNSIKANFGLSEIGNALCNQGLASAPTHIQINLCTLYITIHYTLYEYSLQPVLAILKYFYLSMST